MKKYSSFKEIDRDMEILRVEKQLQKIKLSQSAKRAFNSLTPGNLLAETLGSFTAYMPSAGLIQKFILMLIAKKILK
jgi:hypothetical protein